MLAGDSAGPERSKVRQGGAFGFRSACGGARERSTPGGDDHRGPRRWSSEPSAVGMGNFGEEENGLAQHEPSGSRSHRLGHAQSRTVIGVEVLWTSAAAKEHLVEGTSLFVDLRPWK